MTTPGTDLAGDDARDTLFEAVLRANVVVARRLDSAQARREVQMAWVALRDADGPADLVEPLLRGFEQALDARGVEVDGQPEAASRTRWHLSWQENPFTEPLSAAMQRTHRRGVDVVTPAVRVGGRWTPGTLVFHCAPGDDDLRLAESDTDAARRAATEIAWQVRVQGARQLEELMDEIARYLPSPCAPLRGLLTAFGWQILDHGWLARLVEDPEGDRLLAAACADGSAEVKASAVAAPALGSWGARSPSRVWARAVVHLPDPVLADPGLRAVAAVQAYLPDAVLRSGYEALRDSLRPALRAAPIDLSARTALGETAVDVLLDAWLTRLRDGGAVDTIVALWRDLAPHIQPPLPPDLTAPPPGLPRRYAGHNLPYPACVVRADRTWAVLVPDLPPEEQAWRRFRATADDNLLARVDAAVPEALADMDDSPAATARRRARITAVYGVAVRHLVANPPGASMGVGWACHQAVRELGASAIPARDSQVVERSVYTPDCPGLAEGEAFNLPAVEGIGVLRVVHRGPLTADVANIRAFTRLISDAGAPPEFIAALAAAATVSDVQRVVAEAAGDVPREWAPALVAAAAQLGVELVDTPSDGARVRWVWGAPPDPVVEVAGLRTAGTIVDPTVVRRSCVDGDLPGRFLLAVRGQDLPAGLSEAAKRLTPLVRAWAEAAGGDIERLGAPDDALLDAVATVHPLVYESGAYLRRAWEDAALGARWFELVNDPAALPPEGRVARVGWRDDGPAGDSRTALRVLGGRVLVPMLEWVRAEIPEPPARVLAREIEVWLAGPPPTQAPVQELQDVVARVLERTRPDAFLPGKSSRIDLRKLAAVLTSTALDLSRALAERGSARALALDGIVRAREADLAEAEVELLYCDDSTVAALAQGLEEAERAPATVRDDRGRELAVYVGYPEAGETGAFGLLGVRYDNDRVGRQLHPLPPALLWFPRRRAGWVNQLLGVFTQVHPVLDAGGRRLADDARRRILTTPPGAENARQELLIALDCVDGARAAIELRVVRGDTHGPEDGPAIGALAAAAETLLQLVHSGTDLVEAPVRPGAIAPDALINRDISREIESNQPPRTVLVVTSRAFDRLTPAGREFYRAAVVVRSRA